MWRLRASAHFIWPFVRHRVHVGVCTRVPVCSSLHHSVRSCSFVTQWERSALFRKMSTTARARDSSTVSLSEIKAYSVEDVAAWAEAIDGLLKEDVAILKKQRIDGQQLLAVTKEELVRLYGMPGGPAGKIVDAVNRIKGSDSGIVFSFPAETLVALCRDLNEWSGGIALDVGEMRGIVRGAGFHTRLFVREEGLCLLREWDEDAPYMIVYGTPGIGKSALAQLALARHLALGDPVVFHYKGGTWLLQYDVERQRLLKEAMTNLDGLGLDERPEPEDCVMVFDSAEGFQSRFGLVGTFKKVLIVHSPSGNLNNSRKAGRECRNRLFAPPSREEIIRMGIQLRFIGANMTKSDVEERVTLFGPTFRFAFHSSVEDVRKWVDAGIQKITGAGIENVLNVDAADRLAHGVMLMHENDTGRVVYSFASQYIRDTVCDALANGDVSRLLKLANCPDIHGSLRGDIFENRMLTYMREPASLTFKQGVGPSSPDSTITVCIEASAVQFGVRCALPEVLEVGTCYIPESKTNEAWDAFIVLPEGELAILQFTVGEKHPVSLKGLKKCLEMVKSCRIEYNGTVVRHANSALSSRLVFVVPPCRLPTFRIPQNIETMDKQETKQSPVGSQEKWTLVKHNEERVPWK